MSGPRKTSSVQQSRRRWVGFAAALAGAFGMVGLWQCAAEDASVPSRQEAVSKPQAPKPEEVLDPAEVAARKAAARSLEAQRPEVQRRYYRARIRTSRHSLKTYEALLASLEKSGEGQAKSRAAKPDAEMRKQRLAEVKRKLRERKQKLAEWQQALAALPTKTD